MMERRWSFALALLSLFLLVPVLVFFVPRPAAAEPQIVGGREAVPGAWPWQVAIIRAGGSAFMDQFCGGSLLDEEWVVIAAHCVYPATRPGDIEVLAGIHSLVSPDAGHQRLSVAEIIIHPDYDAPTYDYDVALLRLAEPAQLRPGDAAALPIAPIHPVSTDVGTLEDVMSTVTGWGNQSPRAADRSATLYEVEVPIVSNATCDGPDSYDGEITDRMLCAGYAEGGQDACQGDSGGPLVVYDEMRGRWLLAGIVSWGYGCARPNFYGIYTRVSTVVGWMSERTGIVWSDETPYEVIAGGFNNPRHMTFGPDGALYLAEAGFGGDSPCIFGPEGQVCLGPSGSVTRIGDGLLDVVADGLFSLAAPATGRRAVGPHDVAFAPDGSLYALVGLGADPARREGALAPDGINLGQLARVNADGSWINAVDIAAYEAAENPDGKEPDSNPFSLLVVDDGAVVVDAGGNSLLYIDADGQITTLAVFPDLVVDDSARPGESLTVQAVPTSVALGPDGAYYVGLLTGFPYVEGAAAVLRVPAGGGTPEVYADGFTNIIDLDFDTMGSLYVLEIDSNGLLAEGEDGRLSRISAGGARTTVLDRGLVMPGGVEIGPDGDVYLTNNGTIPAAGQLLRMDGTQYVLLPIALR